VYTIRSVGVLLSAAMLTLVTMAGGCASGGTGDTSPADDAQALPPPPPAEEYVIGPGDVLEVMVSPNTNLSRTAPVRPDGKISLPLINDVQAAGRTPSQLRDDITQRLGPFVGAAEVTVSVNEINSFRVSVLGEVEKPGIYTLKQQMSLVEVLALAGGLTPFAAPNRIVVVRREPGGRVTRIGVRYGDLVKRGDERQNIWLRPGDTVLVPERRF
jgi:polysaccharide export outer membrane protein